MSERDQLITSHLPLVKKVASKVNARTPSSVELADLQAYGLFGLIDAIDKFDPTRGVSLGTYAEHRIYGAMIDELRALDWVPRKVRAQERQTGEQLGRRLESITEEHYQLPAPEVVMEAAMMHDQALSALGSALEGIPERERLVLHLFFTEERTLTSIGEELGVSESRVCQLKARALARLREDEDLACTA